MLFEDILSKPTRAGNKSLIKITSKLVIVSQNKAYEINNILINIFLKILTSPQTVRLVTCAPNSVVEWK